MFTFLLKIKITLKCYTFDENVFTQMTIDKQALTG